MRLLSWIGITDYEVWKQKKERPGPLLGVALTVRPSEIEILWDDGSQKVPVDDREGYKSWLQQQLSAEGLNCDINVHLCENAQVVDFAWVFEKVNELANQIDLRCGPVSANASSGTPVMFACWIVFKKATGLDLHLYQSSKEQGVKEISLPSNLEIDLAEVLQGKSSPLFDRYSKGEIRLGKLEDGTELMHNSQKMKQVLLEATLVAKFTDVPVLLLGPRGVGKSRIARYIHDRSGLPKNAWETVDCGMLVDERSIAELWGWEKGAFTGADKAFDGRITIAQGGTLFLDEIGEADPLTQRNLLRLLQEKKYRRGRSNEEITANVRIVTATNRDLKKELGTGFRQDLFDRLSVFVIQIPALKERREDIVPMATTLLRRFNVLWGKEILAANGSLKTLNKGAERELLHYEWPGNVRELENVVIRVAIRLVGKSKEISREEIRSELNIWSAQNADHSVYEPLDEGFSLEHVLDKMRHHYVLEANRLSNGNKSKMARLLGLDNRSPLKTIIANLKDAKFDLGELS